MTNTYPTIIADGDFSPNEHNEWRTRTQKLSDKIGFLEKEYRARQKELWGAWKTKPKLDRINEKKAVGKASRRLHLVRDAFENQVRAQAIRSCRSLCEAANEKLPQELRDMIARYILPGGDTNISSIFDELTVSHGFHGLRHSFDPEYTGFGFHKDIMNQLAETTTRFHFHDDEDVLESFINRYNSAEYCDLALPSKIKRLSVTVDEEALENREILLKRREFLFRFPSGAIFHFIFRLHSELEYTYPETAGHLFSALFSLFKRLRASGYGIIVVVNPEYPRRNPDTCNNRPITYPDLEQPDCQMSSEDPDFHVDGFTRYIRRLNERWEQDWGMSRDGISPPGLTGRERYGLFNEHFHSRVHHDCER